MEACGGAHYWARELTRHRPQVRLIAPQHAKPYVKRGKNDAADAEAMCEAMSRPTMRFVAVKTAEQQAALMLAGQRDRLVRQRVQLANTIRGYAAEFGLSPPRGARKIEPLLLRLQADDDASGAGPRAVCRARPRNTPSLKRPLDGDRGQADGLAPSQRDEPAAGARYLASGRWSPRCW